MGVQLILYGGRFRGKSREQHQGLRLLHSLS